MLEMWARTKIKTLRNDEDRQTRRWQDLCISHLHAVGASRFRDKLEAVKQKNKLAKVVGPGGAIEDR